MTGHAAATHSIGKIKSHRLLEPTPLQALPSPVLFPRRSPRSSALTPSSPLPCLPPELSLLISEPVNFQVSNLTQFPAFSYSIDHFHAVFFPKHLLDIQMSLDSHAQVLQAVPGLEDVSGSLRIVHLRCVFLHAPHVDGASGPRWSLRLSSAPFVSVNRM